MSSGRSPELGRQGWTGFSCDLLCHSTREHELHRRGRNPVAFAPPEPPEQAAGDVGAAIETGDGFGAVIETGDGFGAVIETIRSMVTDAATGRTTADAATGRTTTYRVRVELTARDWRTAAPGHPARTSAEQLSSIVVDAFAPAPDGGTRRGKASVCRRLPYGDVAGELAALFAEATAQAERLVAAEVPAGAGPEPVVLTPRASGVFFHEVVGHLLEADNALLDAAPFGLPVGTVVAGPHVTVIDDGTDDTAWGGVPFDDEGTSASRTTLIEEGRLTGFLTDRTSIGRAPDMALTGNGRRSSHSRPVLPRMTRTAVVAGSAEPGDLLRAAGSGVIVEDIGLARVRPRDGQFVLHVREARRLVDGRPAGRIGGFALRGDSRAALRSVAAVAGDFAWRPALCTKEGQTVATAAGGPTCLVDPLEVTPTGRWT